MGRAAFTLTELKRIGVYFASVGERVGGVEKLPNGSVRVLTASEAREAKSSLDDELETWARGNG
jgi:hypothetical protein